MSISSWVIEIPPSTNRASPPTIPPFQPASRHINNVTHNPRRGRAASVLQSGQKHDIWWWLSTLLTSPLLPKIRKQLKIPYLLVLTIFLLLLRILVSRQLNLSIYVAYRMFDTVMYDTVLYHTSNHYICLHHQPLLLHYWTKAFPNNSMSPVRPLLTVHNILVFIFQYTFFIPWLTPFHGRVLLNRQYTQEKVHILNTSRACSIMLLTGFTARTHFLPSTISG